MPPEQFRSTAQGDEDELMELFESYQSGDKDDDSAQSVNEQPDEPIVSNRLSTGIEPLDRHLEGGIPPGRIVCYVAPPDTQSELLVKQIAAAHNCLYLSTIRPEWEVDEEVKDFVQKAGMTGSARSSVRIKQLDSEEWLSSARSHLENLENKSIVVIDSINELEDLKKDQYIQFIDDVKRLLWDSGSAGLFYGIDEGSPPPLRSVTLRRADLIWQLRRSVTPGEVEHLLVVTKFRGGRSLTEPVKLELTDEVRIDTSRDIA